MGLSEKGFKTYHRKYFHKQFQPLRLKKEKGSEIASPPLAELA
jgi:hypothetical protein